MAFVELCATSNFTFLTGGSHGEEYSLRATELGLAGFAIADRNSVSGIVRAHVQLRDVARAVEEAQARADGTFEGSSTLGLTLAPDTSVPRLLPATRLCLSSGLEATALPRTRAAWGHLCQILTTGRLRADKGECLLHLDDLSAERMAEIILLLHPQAHDCPRGAEDWVRQARALTRRAPQAALVLAPRYDGQDPIRFAQHSDLARSLGLPTVASAEPIMHHSSRRRLVDVLACIRERRSIDTLGSLAQPNAERRLRSEAEVLRLFKGYEAAVHRSGALAAACQFNLDSLRYEYPSEVMAGEAPQARLDRLTQEGLRWRYPGGIPERAQAQANHELALIGKLNYAPYFLTVQDVVAFARSRGILCQGRGSAANSVVCFALGITSVSPEIGTMVFERFVSEARDEPPDIDVDFEHERREEVIQHIYERYGRHRAGLCATVVHYRGKRAIREVGKAMGLSNDTISTLSSQIWGWGSSDITDARFREIGLDPTDRRLAQTLDLVNQITGFPRHLSQHVGGFVMTEGRLDALVPIENATMEGRTVICWDKDDIDALGILKVDVLSLGMLTCIRKALDMLRAHLGIDHTLASLPPEDPKVYDMLCRADSVGVFQVESRAQMNFLPRMRPRTFYDLVIEVAIVRPGPIQGDMVHPYIRRRRGEEPVEFPSDALGQVLGKT
ncbi:MAG: error-prone DNA polymerase, partial [Pseudomonadota bacterium]